MEILHTPPPISESKYELPDKQVSEDTTLAYQSKEESVKSKMAMIFVYVIVLLCWIVWFAS